jgi:histidinol-phosphatase (PHP family)
VTADWPRVDYHSHICATPLDSMLADARAAGLREFGVSEHIFQLHEGAAVLPELRPEGERCSRDWYVETLQAAAADAPDISIRLGLEVDFVPDRHAEIMAVTRDVPWDYLIGSVHEIDGIDIFEPCELTAAEGERRWLRYYELIAEAIETGAFDVISHPVRYAITNPHLPANLDRLLEETAAFARLYGVALELNGDDMLRTPQLVERLANACGAAGCVVSLGGDAHQRGEVAQGLRAAAALAAAARVPGVISLKQRDRRIIPL